MKPHSREAIPTKGACDRHKKVEETKRFSQKEDTMKMVGSILPVNGKETQIATRVKQQKIKDGCGLGAPGKLIQLIP